MAFLSSFYPQPVVAGTTEGTFAEGDDSRIVGAAQKSANLSDLASASSARANLDLEVGVDVAAFNDARLSDARAPSGAAGGGLAGTYPNPTLAPVAIPFTTNTRSIADRFSDNYVSVLDFGADRTGIEDSTLAIQRCIRYCNASNPIDREAAMTLTYNDVVSALGQPNIPLLYLVSGTLRNNRSVYFPAGDYRITQPLVIMAGTQLIGHDTANSSRLIMAADGTHNAIETLPVWHMRTRQAVDGADSDTLWQYFAQQGDFLADTSIKNIGIYNDLGYAVGGPIHPRTNLETYAWYPFPYNASTFTTCIGSAGSSTVTCSRDPAIPIGTKIRFKGLQTVHTVTATSSNSITFTPPLSTTLSSSNHLLQGVKAQGGIMVGGGESFVIDRVHVGGLAGTGIHVYSGSPAPLIRNTTVGLCDIGYRIDASPFTLLQPSGDANNVFLQCTNFYQGNVIGMKTEDNRSSGLVDSYPYTALNFRCVFDLYAYATGAVNTINVIGGLISIFGTGSGGSLSDFKTNPRTIIQRHEAGTVGNINWFGNRTLGRAEHFVVVKNYRNGDLISGRQVGMGYDGYEPFAHFGGNPAYFDSGESFYEVPLFPSNARYKARQISDAGGHQVFHGAGIVLDKGVLKHLQPATFSRSGNEATFQYKNFENTANANHNLVVGDWIQIYEYADRDPAGSVLSVVQGENGIGSTGVFRVVGVPTSSTFTIEVANSGSNSGRVYFKSYKFNRMHVIQNNCHRFDLPSTAGDPNNEFRAFSVFDSENNQLAGLRSSQIDDSRWWTKGEIGLGGTIGTPASRILHGTGIPSVSAPDGSIFLRTDGDASTTLYVRAGASWKPLASWEP